jgi:hypothetical protein
MNETLSWWGQAAGVKCKSKKADDPPEPGGVGWHSRNQNRIQDSKFKIPMPTTINRPEEIPAHREEVYG